MDPREHGLTLEALQQTIREMERYTTPTFIDSPPAFEQGTTGGWTLPQEMVDLAQVITTNPFTSGATTAGTTYRDWQWVTSVSHSSDERAPTTVSKPIKKSIRNFKEFLQDRGLL